MSSGDRLAHDLFLLLLNLSQVESHETVLRLFTEALESRISGLSLRPANPGESLDEGALPIATPRRSFGHLVAEGGLAGLPAATAALVRNALRMLALILERLERESLLADEKLRLEAAVKARTADLWRLNRSLEREIADHCRTEDALRRSETHLRTVLESSPDIVARLDEAGDVAFINRIPDGWTDEEVLGTSLCEHVCAEDREELRAGLDRVSGSPGESVETRLRTQRGDRTWSARLVPLKRGEDGSAALAILTDITEQRQTEEALEHYHSRLEELVKERTQELDHSRQRLLLSERLASIGTLAAGMAHQINNPLGSILAAAQYAQLCEGDADMEEVWRRALDQTVAEAKRCGRIVRAILQFARDEPTEKWSNDANDLVQRACHVTRSYAKERGATLEFKLCQGDGPIRMNPIEMEQVLVNLIRNGIESRPDGARVDVRCRRTSGTIQIEVRDDGCGIEPDAVEHIFDPFHTTRLKEGGTGLGLSVAHGIVVDHRGRISVASEPDRGTLVTIELPLCKDD